MNRTPDKYEKYGEAHREARRRRLERVDNKCEVTQEKKNLQGHHVQAKYLDVVGQGSPEFESNYMILTDHFHKYLHDITRSERGELVGERQEQVRTIWEDPEDAAALKRLRDIDEVLYNEFVEKMLSNLSHGVREKVIKATLVSFLGTNRDVKIALRQKSIELEQAKEEIAYLRERPGEKARPVSNIIDISNYYRQQYE